MAQMNQEQHKSTNRKKPESLAVKQSRAVETTQDATSPEKRRLDPTRYGDWEKDGRCFDF